MLICLVSCYLYLACREEAEEAWAVPSQAAGPRPLWPLAEEGPAGVPWALPCAHWGALGASAEVVAAGEVQPPFLLRSRLNYVNFQHKIPSR